MKSLVFQKILSETLIVLLFSCLIFLLYSQTFNSPFIFDDWSSIQANPSIRAESLSWEAMKKAAFASKLARRPVPYITLALNYYVHEYDVLGYHLVNTVIHLVTGILVFYFFQTTLNLTQQHRAGSPSNRWLALAVAVIWLVHPLHIQSVTYIIQRMNSLAVMFYILALLLYIKGRLASSRNASIIFFLGCAFSALMAFGCKETAYTLPFFIFLYEWFFGD